MINFAKQIALFIFLSYSISMVIAQNPSVLDYPQTMSKYKKNTGTTFLVKIKGTQYGNVWGGSDGFYTDDSQVAKAAVHAGLVKVGEEAILKITMYPGQKKYTGSTQNGITTSNYGSFTGSYKFEKNEKETSASNTSVLEYPQNMIKYKKNTGTTFLVKIKGTQFGNVWGGADGFYTDDSQVAKAAVHAGLVKVGEEAILKITMYPGQKKYTGSTQNGITTSNYGPFTGSYKFEK